MPPRIHFWFVSYLFPIRICFELPLSGINAIMFFTPQILTRFFYPQVLFYSRKQRNKALTLAHAQTILYTSN